MNDRLTIPLCRSEFLQNFTIDLGLYFRRRSHFGNFTLITDACDHQGSSLERLSLWAENPYGTGATLTLYEDRVIRVGVFLRAAPNNEEYRVGFHPQSHKLAAPAIIEAFRDTFNVSTRLCYAESPLPILRRIWNHTGDVEISGRLPRRKGVKSEQL